MTIKTKYDFEQEVYLRTDADQQLHVITEIIVKPGNLILYELTCGHEASTHYEFEISTEKSYK